VEGGKKRGKKDFATTILFAPVKISPELKKRKGRKRRERHTATSFPSNVTSIHSGRKVVAEGGSNAGDISPEMMMQGGKGRGEGKERKEEKGRPVLCQFFVSFVSSPSWLKKQRPRRGEGGEKERDGQPSPCRTEKSKRKLAIEQPDA